MPDGVVALVLGFAASSVALFIEALSCVGLTRAGLADDDSTSIDAVFLVAKDRITGYLVHAKVDAVAFQNIRDLE